MFTKSILSKRDTFFPKGGQIAGKNVFMADTRSVQTWCLFTQKDQGWFHSKQMKDLIYKTFHIFRVQWDDYVQDLPCVTPRYFYSCCSYWNTHTHTHTHTLSHWQKETLRSLSKSLKPVYWSKWVILVQSAPHTLWAPTCWGSVLHKILNLR